MSWGLRVLFFAGLSVCALALPDGALAVPMGSVAPHGLSATASQQSQQWLTDTRSKCIAADPTYDPDDSISWEGVCRKDGMIYGPGNLTYLNKGRVVETINGVFMDGLLKPGRVIAKWADGSKYTGDQLGGLFNGTGKFTSPKGDTFDGEWKMGVLNGKGSAVWANGDRYDGEWKYGKSDGQGVEVWADGRRYEGAWQGGEPVGEAQADASAGGTQTTSGAAPAVMAQGTSVGAAKPATLVAAAPAAVPATAATFTRTAVVPKSGNAMPNPALPLRSSLGTQMIAVDGATLELALSRDGFARSLLLPNGTSQAIEFAFANGPVGTVSDGEKAIGVFRANPSELDIDFADGTTESIIESANGGLVDRAKEADGRTMCTAWYPQGHVFSQNEKQAAVQEYAARLGVAVSAPATKKHKPDAAPVCGGAFIASGPSQMTGSAAPGPAAVSAPPSGQHAQSAAPLPGGRTAAIDNAVAVRTPAIHVIDGPATPARDPAHLQQASYTPPPADTGAAMDTPPPKAGASDCLTVTSNGEYWGFQNRCAKSVQFAYCEMSDANPLTSCKETSVAGSVAANGFSALVSDRSLAEKGVNHEFRWMACDGGAGEVVPHLDKVDPPAGRCERAVPPPG